jgi:PEGA domain
MLLESVILSWLLSAPLWPTAGQAQPNNVAVPVVVVATASEYVPRSTTVSHPGHSYTDCVGDTSYFGRFDSYGNSGTISGSASTTTRCNSTFSPPSETTLTTYSRVNYTIARSDHALYLLSCTQTWSLTAAERVRLGIMGAAEGGSGSNSGATGRAAANAKGKWSECPAFIIGSEYTLTVRDTSDARLKSAAASKPIKLDFLSSAELTVQNTESSPVQPQDVSTAEARVHITSTPDGGEIYIDGKFVGNTPSYLTLPAGEHTVRITFGGKEWSRSVQITPGEISLHAEIPEK